MRTIQAYAQKVGWTVPREETLLDRKQTTLIVEAMKARGGQGLAESAQENLRRVETPDSRALRIELRHRQIDELHKQIEAELAELRVRNEAQTGQIEDLSTRLGDAQEWWSVKRVMAVTGREYP